MASDSDGVSFGPLSLHVATGFVPRRSVRAATCVAFRCGDSIKGIVVNVCMRGIENKARREQNLESPAKVACCARTLTFILSLAGRRDERALRSVCKDLRSGKETEKSCAVVTKTLPPQDIFGGALC